MMVIMMNKIYPIKKKFPIVNGLFSKIDFTFLDFNSYQLDLMLISKCGKRICSTLCEIVSDDHYFVDEYFTEAELQEIANIILNSYKNKWDRLLDLLELQYNPLNSYYDDYSETLNDATNQTIDRDSTDTLDGTKAINFDETVTIDTSLTSSNSSTTEAERQDQYNSTYTRTIDEDETRTDNLSSTKTITGTDTNSRTDNLSSAKTITGTDTNLRTDNLLSTVQNSNSYSESETIDNELAGFNSIDRVDTTGANNSTTSTDATSGTTANTGTQTDQLTHNTTDTTLNTGTQTNQLTHNTTDTTHDTGTQTKETDTSISDRTQNTDNQTNTIESTLQNTSETENTTTTDSTTQEVTHSTDVLAFDEVKAGTLARMRSYSHAGNTGNITPQKLLTEELELRKWNFINEVMNDVKSVISIPVYL